MMMRSFRKLQMCLSTGQLCRMETWTTAGLKHSWADTRVLEVCRALSEMRYLPLSWRRRLGAMGEKEITCISPILP